ncbi:MAG TPA: D-glycerate dehydrogenase [Phycisphaerales bacterium]|nr:D-glycerate dehydrogenase [Phycisphaerales bacterium]
MQNQRIVITRPIPGPPEARLRAAAFDNIWVNPVDERLSRPALLEAVRGAVAVLATPADTLINHEFFDAAGPQLSIVSNYAVGVDNIDLAEAKRRGLVIGHTPNAVTEPTADIAWLLLLGAAKRAFEGQTLVRSGTWKGVAPHQLLGTRVHRKTLLIVGAGRIGLATARRSIGFEMPLLYVARSQHPEFESPPFNARRVALEGGLRQADFISIHTPLSAETRHLINRQRLALMKPTAILINTSRGGVIDESALVEALREKRLAAAGLDVYEREPHLASGLADLPNTYLLPHLGSATVEDRVWMSNIAADNIIAHLRGEPLPHQYPI